MKRQASPYRASKWSALADFPARPIRPDGVSPRWEHWDKWAVWAGLTVKGTDKPSRSKVRMLWKNKCLSHKVVKRCIPRTFHRTGADGNPIYRQQMRIVVTPRFPEQLEWGPAEWQECWADLFSRSQSRRARKKRWGRRR